jgi:tRNA (cytidine/uridine-2'-O-)-methyltransferase
MDYIDHVNYTRHNSWNHFREWAAKNGHRIILLSSKATTSYTEFKFLKNDILMLGRESAGVPEDVSKNCNHSVTIPMQPNTRSLNVAISAAIVLGEAIRQTKIV